MVRRAYPVRTCVGCRERAPVSDLLRVIASARTSDDVVVYDVVPDPTRRLPGRGAHLHAHPDCLALAVKRRAFGRAFRVAGVTETGVLAQFISELSQGDGPSDGGAPDVPIRIEQAGRPK